MMSGNYLYSLCGCREEILWVTVADNSVLYVPGPAAVYVPKFRPQRARRLPSQRRTTLDELAEEGPERHASAEPEDHGETSKRASAPTSLTRHDREKTPEECIVLLPNEQPSASAEPEDDDKPPPGDGDKQPQTLEDGDKQPQSLEDGDGDKQPRSLSQKGRGKFQRQDESIV